MKTFEQHDLVHVAGDARRFTVVIQNGDEVLVSYPAPPRPGDRPDATESRRFEVFAAHRLVKART